jgi:predicted amidophosphoribosyltransferase
MRHCGKDMTYIAGGVRCDECGKTLTFGKGKAEKKEKKEEAKDGL